MTEAWIESVREQYDVTDADMEAALIEAEGDPDGLIGALAERGYPC